MVHREVTLPMIYTYIDTMNSRHFCKGSYFLDTQSKYIHICTFKLLKTTQKPHGQICIPPYNMIKENILRAFYPKYLNNTRTNTQTLKLITYRHLEKRMKKKDVVDIRYFL